ncbi:MULTISPECIES: type II toxin-antitoxin system VapC family toxin [unclassified Actinomyces]|uniref:type II toxin-antitoxin system VapC family toxin n=1 Tax=unclassified Actinomyces TaxID=2609248 RepID=UPI000D590250|nr:MULTISPECIES: type II toxin-antitoxin system VapC family toxin [unclassified Actinomyces]RAX23714.1 PIN domain-containing protein [Actinomyces sp. Z3]
MPAQVVYLDSSVALRTILDAPERKRVQAWMQSPGMTLVSSRLLRTEVIRVLRRENRPLRDGLPLLDRVGLIDITRQVHTVAESIERHVKTLDALHLATALVLGETSAVATHDATMKTVAENLGLSVIDPVECPSSPNSA